MTVDDNPEGLSTRTVVEDLMEGARRSARGEPSEEAEAAIEELFPTGQRAVAFTMRFCSLVVLSSMLASFGLLADSGAVVIGAMLVAPLMTPILAASAAVVRAENRRLLWALAVIGGGTALAIAVGWLVSAVAAQALGDVIDLPGEVRSRTFPGLLDLGIAVTAGAAAGYVLPRRDALSALPGVGIAVALVPPLSTVGITLQLDRLGDAEGALLLYGTNLAAIIFAASLMLVLVGFRPHPVQGGSLAARLLVTAVIVALVALPLTLHTRSAYEDNELRSAVVRAVPAWDDTVEIVSVDADVIDSVANVDLQIVGPNEPLPSWRLAQDIADRVDFPVELVLRYERVSLFEVSTR